MYLKRIELAGFKTFPDHTEVVLSPGVTAVVGPNGCGKSNLMDAVRWVLGEQRPRVLRGGKMDEVIFSGTPQRPGMSAAEVTLTIDNQSGRLPTDFVEVAVSRRIDRSGESEYRLNGTPCRLKDLADLFLDTGMGSHGYAVIQAAMIDAILSENPDERRFLFEEAAGVSKYKLRQRAALRKLEATEQDLVRLMDLKNEVATRVRSLARQKGMAERHRHLRDSWRAAEVILGGREYHRLLAQAAALAEQHRTAREAATGMTAQCETLELEGQTLRLAVDEAERVAQSIADRLTDATSRWHQHQTEQVRREDRQKHLENERGQVIARQATLSARALEAEDRQRRATERRQDAQLGYQEVVQRAGEAESDFLRARDEAARKEDEARRLEQEWIAAHEAYLKSASQREALTQHHADIERRRQLLRERSEQFGSQIALATAQVGKLETAFADARRNLTAACEQATAAQTKLAELDAAHARLVEEAHDHSERLAELRSGREMMAALIARGEGLGRAATQVLSDSARWGGRVVGWIDRLRPHPEWRRAIEAALADRVGALWCDDQQTAQELAAYLMQASLGRAAVLDPALLSSTEAPRPQIHDPGFAGWLADKVDCDDADRGWLRGILGNVATAVSSDDARRLFVALGGHHCVVARDGVVISPPGVMSIGAEEADPIVGRTYRLQELDEKIAAAEHTLQSHKHELGQVTSQAAMQREQSAAGRSRVEGLESEVSALQLTLEREGARLDENRRQAGELTTELDSLAEAAAVAATPAGDHAIGELKGHLDRASEARQAAETAVAAAEQRIHAAAASLNGVRVEMVEVQARVDAALTEIERYRDMLAEIALEQTALDDRLSLISSELEDLDLQLRGAAEQRSALAEERDRLEMERLQARATVAREKERLSQLEQRLREARHHRDEVEARRAQVELELSGVRFEAEQCRRRLFDTHQIDLDSAVIDDPPESDEELRRKAEALTQSIERLGPVNPLALEEYQREKERWSFLEHQVGDLRQAKTSLAETIAELNRTAGERFLETFATARSHFQEVFTELFRGGEADVRLLEPEKPLESPIEIFARPRGKKFIGIRQLSGGERALTALALLFGLYLVKPSPFCILDEVDAPLDDANCGRFLRLVDRFKARTQFIVVTHNKLTMEAADVLYGITMEDAGVSRIVSVRLDRAGEEGGEPGLAEPRFAIAATNGTEVSEAVPAGDAPLPD
jgi:chromosome segregation protein